MKVNAHTLKQMNATSLKTKLPRADAGEMPLDLKLLIVAVCQAGFPAPYEEVLFHDTRKYRFDLAWPDYGVAFEREGGTYIKANCKQCGHETTHFRSRHHDQKGMEEDVEKYNAAQTLGWSVIRGTTPMMRDGRAIAAVLEALKAAKENVPC